MERRRAADFLELVERSRRGRLKVYIGFAAGVGKTYRMLEEAHALAKRGVDIVVGLVETHGRSETAALLEGLEVVPRRVFEYRGLKIEEMDLDAVLARHPQVAIVDEIAHTNVPGSRNTKRYQDACDLLDAGISVICAFNIQHLESLKDLVEQATHVEIRETVPDTFLQQADQVVNLDLAVEDLLERLRAGKIYAEEKVRRALENFFQADKLSMLRELALREVAESLGRAALGHPRGAGAEPGAPRAPSERVMVCIASQSPRSSALLRRGSRLAGRLNTDWYVVYVETPSEAPHRIDSSAQRMLHANIEKARELGAQIVRLQGRDRVETLLDFARSHAVGHILIGRSHTPWWRRLLSRDFVASMVRQAEDFDLHIVGAHEQERAA
ncbi:MAG TPA: histidine kinase [Deltaproteobacteria bacterium]|nr:histidine kinase [Deltaproteobacteria bacterium]